MYRLMQSCMSTYAVLTQLVVFLPVSAFYSVIYIILQLSKD